MARQWIKEPQIIYLRFLGPGSIYLMARLAVDDKVTNEPASLMDG